MKRVVSLVLTLVLLIGVIPILGRAVEVETITFEDGSFAIIETSTYEVRASGSISGNKKYTYYSNSGLEKWKAVLTGKFTYTGSSATCTSSSVSVSISDADWYQIYKSASKSGNKATASVTMGYKLDGETIMSIPVSLTLTCDANGNLS